jgi:hypothetical protein
MSEKLGELYVDLSINQQQIASNLKKMETQVNTSFKSLINSSKMVSRAISMALGISLNQVVNRAIQKLKELEGFKKFEITLKGIAADSFSPLKDSFNKIFENLSNALKENKDGIKQNIDNLVSILKLFTNAFGSILTFFAKHPNITQGLAVGSAAGIGLSYGRPFFNVLSKSFGNLSKEAEKLFVEADVQKLNTIIDLAVNKKFVTLSEYYSATLTPSVIKFVANVTKALSHAGQFIIKNLSSIALATAVGVWGWNIGKSIKSKLGVDEEKQNEYWGNSWIGKKMFGGPQGDFSKVNARAAAITQEQREASRAAGLRRKQEQEAKMMAQNYAFENYRYKLRKAAVDAEERMMYTQTKNGKILTQTGAFLSHAQFNEDREKLGYNEYGTKIKLNREYFANYFRDKNSGKYNELWGDLDTERKRSGSLLSGSMGYMSAGFLGSGFAAHITPGEKAIVKAIKELEQTTAAQTELAFQMERTYTG